MQRNKELGSEFCFETCLINRNVLSKETLVLSGRTAIDLIIQDIKKKRKLKSAYLPAYCCDSMIDPFIRNGIDVNLYDISFDGDLHYLIDEEKQTDVFYVNNYFGYENTIDSGIIKHFKQKGVVIIYDKTHSLFMSNDTIDGVADYSFSSIRKWMGVVCGAVVDKLNGHFDIELKDYPYLQCKIDAMTEKAKFIDGDTSIEKQSFLGKFGEFGQHLSDTYEGYKMDVLSTGIWQQSDKLMIRNKRRENAAILHKQNLQFIGDLSANSCPLFVPVFFKTLEERDLIRRRLTDNQIYCPIHWPKNKLITSTMHVNRIYDSELSLICDQRYNISDMDRIVKVINQNIRY